jgi:hypothetical protein
MESVYFSEHLLLPYILPGILYGLYAIWGYPNVVLLISYKYYHQQEWSAVSPGESDICVMLYWVPVSVSWKIFEIYVYFFIVFYIKPKVINGRYIKSIHLNLCLLYEIYFINIINESLELGLWNLVLK